ncbi:MAG: hypothetical protein DI598_12825 [Pseudopedobacter saltans]|uniref:Lipoprotein n=1 Tax=Pseudopedobacter saltans TaxID=151895 RepID=A0A2W5EX02_9SPHI|nr:MAG: hypothetical protein DI598_12825 [Pseudopedobacter saltans]
MKKIILMTLLATFFFACKNSSSINAEEAGRVVTTYLKGNPEFKTTKFDFGELKFNSKKEYAELENYRQLASEGYITLNLLSAKKKFLSKDSSFTYSAKLTQKASEYVLKQDANNATVKAVTYELTEEKPVDFSKVNDAIAKVTVSLKKMNTPFVLFQKNPQDNSEFLTKTYKLKYDKEEGWKVKN